ncbi:hypothetical protein BC936DRAFT_142176 [Jimgerdemannia flammicorona]|uniref:Uncharacterized protein n=1 Tax=Jimgerdemannia flammicorona TaxID=994334 RepID=A0A433DFI3_9FUNG|nr:hypothetical protein BC936DRAFT_142176 [Jimgerdemannia flammicorona]
MKPACCAALAAMATSEGYPPSAILTSAAVHHPPSAIRVCPPSAIRHPRLSAVLTSVRYPLSAALTSAAVRHSLWSVHPP